MEGLDPDGDWKGCRLDGINPDVVAGREVDWKGWIQMGTGRDVDWKGYQLEGSDQIDAIVVDCSDQCCCC